MAKENSRELKLKYIFNQYPEIKELHVTSDDQAFKQENDAKAHARTLDDKEVALVKRGEYVAAKFSTEESDEDKRAALFARHLELFGKEPASNAKTETVAAKIAAKEADNAAAGSKGGADPE